ncbi:MAG TPA: tetratricopeptide repeat protein [Pyrinomonadaceae bacterium]|nr:tetratricopeptide repeat protein [Pyrinomonadaceae bacterium]
MYTLITFATQWGSKYGGINSFNADFLTAYGFAYHLESQIVCIVASDTPEARAEASRAHVRLVSLPYTPQAISFGREHGEAGIEQLKKLEISFDPDKTVWLGHDRITGAAAIAAAKLAGGRSAVIHHMSYDHYESYAEDSQSASRKTQDQTALFQSADIVLAVGPLLRDAGRDRLGGAKPVHMLIPGLAEIEPLDAPKTFVAFLSGRLSDDAARIKQSHLGIAAFAKAQRDARNNRMPDALRNQPKLLLRGVDFEGRLTGASLPAERDPETDLKRFAEEYAQAVINLHALPYTHDRQELYNELRGASVALMPSWHEGFGLVAWEAIAANVPLIVSKNSGVYRLLEENYPGVGTGCVYPLEIRGAVSSPFFHEDDLKETVSRLNEIANDPGRARRQAGMLKTLLGENTWTACAEQAAKAFGWNLQKGSIPVTPPVTLSQTTSPVAPASVPSAAEDNPLQMPAGQWRAGLGMADSQLLRAEESLLAFDPARQPDVDSLNEWLDDSRWPQSVRLITGAGGQGKTRLALELCRQRFDSGWHTGFLDSELEGDRIKAGWQTLRSLNRPLLIVIDYAETRQATFLTLLRASLQNPVEQPVRMLLLARDSGEWWDNLPGKDPQCEPLLSGYATTGPFRLPALYAAEPDRQEAYGKALLAFSQALGVSVPDIVPVLQGEHFERPLYVQMAALLALYGERPTTAQGLTRALLNHERRYWLGLLAQFNWREAERRAEQLLALATLAGGFASSNVAAPYWATATGSALTPGDFDSLFRSLMTLYPGSQGLQALRPDLLGEALVAQALLRSGGDMLLDSVLSNSVSTNTAAQAIRRNALTVLARLSTHHLDLSETLVNAISRHFRHSCQDIVTVSAETNSRLPALAESAFARMSSVDKSQTTGLLAPLLKEESVQLAELRCMVFEYLAEKSREKFNKKPGNLERMAEYANASFNYAISLASIGNYQLACDFDLTGLTLYRRLIKKDPDRFEPDYAGSLDNYASHLSDAGRYEEVLKYARQALEINRRLAQKNLDRFEPNYSISVGNYANYLSDMGRYEEALPRASESLEIDRRLAQKNPDRFEPDYAQSLDNYASHLSYAGRYEEALDYSNQALTIHRRLAQKNLDRFEPNYARSAGNYASHLSNIGRYEAALPHAREALEIHKRLAQKNPDRFEPDYARSLSNYAGHLEDAGRYEEALDYANQSLAINGRLAQKNPDRFEPGYARSLSNCASYMEDAGRYEEALDYVSQALSINRRLAQKNPRKSMEGLFSNTCFANFLGWLINRDKGGDSPDPSQLTFISEHRRPLMLLFLVFVNGCLATDQTTRADAFRQVLSIWDDLSIASKTKGEPLCLCAAAWCATFEQADMAEAVWMERWRQFARRRNGRPPQWMLDVARRLEFRWPV